MPAYSLETKIRALNQLEQCDGDAAAVSAALNIREGTVRRWRRNEEELRRRHSVKQAKALKRVKVDLLTKMLERGQELLALMDAEALEKAPLNQLASALNVLVTHALKIEETIGGIDDEREKVVRFEYYYDDEVQDAPPWTGASEGRPRAVQGSLLREALGEDGVGEVSAGGAGADVGDSRLVAGADASDVEPSVARLEGVSAEG